ncbi:MAG: LamG-like jellyroll fold domain-containing protein [Planctomycetota bacterium]|jgi:TolA-binding protein
MVKYISKFLPILFCVLSFEMTDKALAGTSTQTVKAVTPNSAGLVAHYELEGNVNDSTGTNHGIECGSPTYGTGVFGQAINLDGDGDYVNCGKASSFDLANLITVAAWIKVTTFDKKYQTIISKGDNSWRLARANDSGNVEFACNGTASTKWSGKSEVPWAVLGTTSVDDGKWHHIAGVFDGSGLYLYIDGVLEAAKGAGRSIDISNHDMCIGANAQVPGREWKGLIEDVRIYNYALSQAEIVSVMGKSEINLPEPVPTKLYNIAKRYDGLKKRADANGVCELILQKYPDSPFASNAQIYISKRNILYLIQSKKFTTAQAEFDNLIADFNDHPDLAEALYAIAQAYSPPRKFKEAESVYRQLIQLFPDSPYAVEALFRAPKVHVFYLIKSRNHTEAQVAIDKFISDFLDHPATPGVLYWFAKEFEASKTYDKAKSTYQKVIFEYPAAPHALKAELKVPKMDVMSLIESGNDDAVLSKVNSLIGDFTEHPDLSETLFNIGEQYYIRAFSYEKQGLPTKARENLEKTIGVWEKGITKLPSSSAYAPQTYYFSAVCYGRLGEYDKALGHYQKVVNYYPKYDMAWNALFRVGNINQVLKKSGAISQSVADLKTKAAYEQLLEKYPKCKVAEHVRDWLSR